MDYDYGNDAIDDNMAPGVSGNVDEVYRDYHLELDGRICDAASNFVPTDTIPPPLTLKQPGDWMPYHKFLYKKVQMSAGDIDKLMHLWGLGLAQHGDTPPFADHRDLYSTIDEMPIGDVTWQSFLMKYGADADPASDLTLWMDTTYTTWFHDPHTIICNMLGNPDFKNEMDYALYHEWKGQGESATRQWHNVMSGDWAWDQADEIAKDPAMHGSMFVPVILRSDKTTVSVAMGQNDYYPLYASIGNIHNNVCCAHHNVVAIIGFLAIPKTTKKHSDDLCFRKFKKQLFHSSLSWILSSLKPAMSVPEVVQFGDRHFRCVVYGLSPYIADYPEQLVLGCVVQNWCTKCFAYPDNLDSSEGGLRSREVVDILCDEVDAGVLWEEWGVISDVVLLAPDILHQVIKGAFKDHLVAWVEKYLKKEHGKTCAKAILDDIDHRIAAAPPFAGLHRFPQGHGFSQWTGDNSKALMKVYLPDTLLQLSDCLGHFHRYRQIFQDTSIQFNRFSLPRQHTLCHYSMLIHLFGAPNGICSSITESKHIKAIKEPWCHSSKFNALGQMLLTNHLTAATTATAAAAVDDDDDDDGTNDHHDGDDDSGEDIQINPADQADSERPHLDKPGDGIIEEPRAQCNVKLAHTHSDELHILDLPHLVRLFLFDQLLADDMHTSDTGRIKIFNSAAASFYAPSDPSGVGPAHNNTVLVNTASEDGINGMDVSHVLCFFSFQHSRETFPCTLIHWFKLIANEPNPDTGMWMVRPSFHADSSQELSIIHIDTIIHACHLLPIFDSDFASDNLTLHNILDIWPSFYVNRFIDHHVFEIAY
ncbi:uncharacterized protein BJ212DRAFT_1446229 [Suillus subaureus]|uniref:Uncharacterized protein n=1 Tax=Suillus subaureus TaxID=48587 RepID=A0A9P7EDW7_9AGAM|nr:uncharacterized protein BJ212DRAFT_1446229 [Suillus subaureus]KAG1819102.1 hypothetical protein BJ212DRAFT_1446229 [Suillus subaureus]